MKAKILFILLLSHEFTSTIIRSQQGQKLLGRSLGKGSANTPSVYYYINAIFGFLAGYFLSYFLFMTIFGGFSDIKGIKTEVLGERTLKEFKIIKSLSRKMKGIFRKGKVSLGSVMKPAFWRSLMKDKSFGRRLGKIETKLENSPQLNKDMGRVKRKLLKTKPPGEDFSFPGKNDNNKISNDASKSSRRKNRNLSKSSDEQIMENISRFSDRKLFLENFWFYPSWNLDFECEGRMCYSIFRFFLLIGIVIGLVVASAHMKANSIPYESLRKQKMRPVSKPKSRSLNKIPNNPIKDILELYERQHEDIGINEIKRLASKSKTSTPKSKKSTRKLSKFKKMIGSLNAFAKKMMKSSAGSAFLDPQKMALSYLKSLNGQQHREIGQALQGVFTSIGKTPLLGIFGKK